MSFFLKRISLSVAFSWATLLILSLCTVAIVVLYNTQMRDFALNAAKDKALLVIDRNLAIHSYFSEELKPRVFEVIEERENPQFFEPSWMSSTYAVRRIHSRLKSAYFGDIYYKEAAINARSPENEANDYEKEFILELNKSPDRAAEEMVRVVEGETFYTVLKKGETMSASCMRCHSTPDKAPADMVEKYSKTRSFGREVGEVVSVMSVRVPITEVLKDVDDLSKKVIGFLAVIIAIVFIAQKWLVDRLILIPLNKMKNKSIEITEDISRLGEQLDVAGGTELEALAKNFNKMSLSLKESKDDLDRKIETRTKELEAQNRELEQYTHTVSHDLKAPLITIKGFGELLKQELGEGVGDNARTALARIIDASDKMLHLLHALLELSKAGKVIGNPATVSMSELAEETIALVAGDVRAKKELFVVSSELPNVIGDRLCLGQVLQNLIENSFKYLGDQPNPRIEIGVRSEKDESVFFVKDNGIGIKKEQQEKIFDLFTQVDPKRSGTGVGLSLVKKIVEIHDGRIWVESDGEGSTFCFTIGLA